MVVTHGKTARQVIELGDENGSGLMLTHQVVPEPNHREGVASDG